jgi:hypothetical protein
VIREIGEEQLRINKDLEAQYERLFEVLKASRDRALKHNQALVTELANQYDHYLTRLAQAEREIRFGRTAMETERAGVFHIGSIEEVTDVVQEVTEMTEDVEREIRSRWDEGAIRDVALHDIGDLEGFRQLEVTTHELATNRQRMKNTRGNMSAVEMHQQKSLQHKLAHKLANTKHHSDTDDSKDENNMSTDSILEEKIMLNLLDMHKKAKLLIQTPDLAERDHQALERSLIKRGPSPISKTPRGGGGGQTQNPLSNFGT